MNSEFQQRNQRPVPSPFAGIWTLTLLALFAGSIAGCSSAPSAAPPPLSPPPPPADPIAVEPQSEWAESILYFVVLDRFADGDTSNNAGVDRKAKGTFHGGDLKGLIAQLNEISELGATALWITPVVKNIDGFVTGAGFPDWGYHGYWADDFYALDERFGTEEDLKALVDAAHARGIKVLLDVVYNHPGYDSQYAKDPATRGWLRLEDRGECGDDDITGCLAGLPDFRTEDPEVADYLLKAHLELAKRVGLDGFRLDTVKHVTHEFWQEHRRRIQAEIGDDFFLLGEVWGGDNKVLDPWFENDEMDAGFDFSFQGSTLGFVRGRGRPVAFNRYLEKRGDLREGYLVSHFLSNHDTPGAIHQLEGDTARFRLAALLQFVSNGIPQIFYGEEVGRKIGDWPFNRTDMPWGDRAVEPGAGDERDEDLRAFYKQLIAARRAYPALWRGVHKGLAFDKDTLAFVKEGQNGDADVVVVVNRGVEPAEVEFAAPTAWSGAVRDVLTDEIVGAGEELRVSVGALQGRILVSEDS